MPMLGIPVQPEFISIDRTAVAVFLYGKETLFFFFRFVAGCLISDGEFGEARSLTGRFCI